MANTNVAEIELAPGRIAWAPVEEDGDRIITWPSDLGEKEFVEKLVDVLVADETTADWPRDIVANDGHYTIQGFMETEGDFIEGESGLIRFNAGYVRLGGFSVTAMINDGSRELQGVFDPNYGDLAKRIIDQTIIDGAKERVEEIFNL